MTQKMKTRILVVTARSVEGVKLPRQSIMMKVVTKILHRPRKAMTPGQTLTKETKNPSILLLIVTLMMKK